MICLGDNKMQGLSTQARIWIGILTVLTLSGAFVLTFGNNPVYSLAFGIMAVLRAIMLFRQVRRRRHYEADEN